MLKTQLTKFMIFLIIFSPQLASAGDGAFSFSRFFKHKPAPETATIQLARTLDDLEKKLNKHGTVVAKAPDIWGEARLTKHRQEFEREMEKQVGKFELRLNAAISRSDQALLSSAFAISAFGGGATSTSASPPLDFTNIQNLVPGINQTSDTEPPAEPGTTQNSTIYVSGPGGLRPAGLAEGLKDKGINIEPTIHLDQMARYLNHLHEIRRMNEGDDTSDSPGYSLNMVRIPVSIMPGSYTRMNHGAEITVTATPHVTDELLPKVFRQLVINDLVDLLAPPLRKLAQDLPEIVGPPEDIRRLLDGGAAIDSSPESLVGKVQQFQPPTRVRHSSHETLRILTPVPATPPMTRQSYQKNFRDSIQMFRFAMPVSSNRTARSPVPPSNFTTFFGSDELLGIADDLHFRLVQNDYVDTVKQDNNLLHLSDIRAHLQTELEAAYDFLAANPAILHSQCPPAQINAALQTPGDVNQALLHFRNQVSPLRLRELRLLKEKLHVDTSPSVTTSLAWAIVLESALLNQRLVNDINLVSKDPGCHCLGAGDYLNFASTNPDLQARQVFADYVKCRWPIHVFALDPQSQDQNVSDSFSMRREMQLALALSFASGRTNARNMTRYVRRLELDMETVALNRTAAAFGHGKDVFGWRFYPRVQSPPFESNATTVFRDLIRGGPNKDDLRRSWEIEPGMRECTAIVLMPSFITHATFDVRGNYFPLGRHKFFEPSDTRTSIEDTVEMSHKIRLMENAACSLAAEENCYRNGEAQRLLRRVDQISKKLPLQTVHARVPNENTFGGFEMFSSGVTDLAPELLDFYGMPGVDPAKESEMFLVGNNFSVHDTHVIAGNRDIKFSLISRQVMKVTIPAGVQTIKNNECHEWKTCNCSPGAPGWCNQPKHYVDLHIATPYGVSQHLHIPTVETDAKDPVSGYRWTREDMRATYRVGRLKTGDAFTDYEVKEENVLIQRPHRLHVSIPAGPFPHPESATINFVFGSPQVPLALTIVEAENPVTATLDRSSNSYVVDGSEFIKLQMKVKERVVAWQKAVNGKVNPPSTPMEAHLSGTITLGNGGNLASVKLDNILRMHIEFETIP